MGTKQDAESEETEPVPSSSTQQSQPVHKFQQHWLKLCPWLTTRISDKGVTWITCKLCVKHNKHNALTDQGTNNFCTSTLTRHAACDHKAVVLAESMKGQLQEALDKAPSEKEEVVVIGLKAVYWLAKENLPLHKYESLMKLLVNLRCPTVEKLNVSKAATF